MRWVVENLDTVSLVPRRSTKFERLGMRLRYSVWGNCEVDGKDLRHSVQVSFKSRVWRYTGISVISYWQPFQCHNILKYQDDHH